jgi:hypothetical protein
LPASHVDAGDVDKLEERILHILLYCTVLYSTQGCRYDQQNH